MIPSWLFTMAMTVDSPRPVPLFSSLVVKKGSKILSQEIPRYACSRVGHTYQDVTPGLGLDIHRGVLFIKHAVFDADA